MDLQVNTESPFYKMGAALADIVFAPDYYQGEWWITFKQDGKHRVKICKSYTTALAWANYLKRQGYDAHFDGILLGKNYHGNDKAALFKQLRGHFGYREQN